MGDSRLLIVEVNEAIGSNDRTVLWMTPALVSFACGITAVAYSVAAPQQVRHACLVVEISPL